MIDAVDATGSARGSEGSASASNGSVDKQAFLRLLTAQLQHQDPLAPMDDTEFISQLAQFTSLEQAMETNARLEAIALQQVGLSNAAIAGLVGQAVTIRGNTVTLDGNGIGEQVSYTLDAPSASVKVTIRDSSGRVVRTIDAGPQGAGAASVMWDGKDESGTVQPAGQYQVNVEATNEAGESVGVTQETTGTLVSVSFESGYATLHLDTGASAPAAELIRVGGVPSATEPEAGESGTGH